MATVSFKCPNCGGPTTFDPAKQLFDCDYCRSEFDEATLTAYAGRMAQQSAAQAEQAQAREDAGEQVVYNCPSCGAQIVTDPTTAATFCYYCHSPVVLTGRLAAKYRPDQVLPFTIDREQAVNRFLDWTKKYKYVPRDFFSADQLEKICGVYYPYWMADYRGVTHFVGEGTLTTTRQEGRYNVTDTAYYQVVRDAEVKYDNLARPALSKADRKLADGVHPYNMEQAREFSPAYLSGFMAEKRDIEAEQVRPEVEQEIENYTLSMIRAGERYSSLNGHADTEYTEVNYKYCLLPAWVLTYKGRDGQLYYYAMNGQTGQVCGRLPISKGKLWANTGVVFAVAAALLLVGGWLLF
ncbi:MAG: TFIIB-type zinc ribbon-containing protein [Bacillota bacterium]|nr:TFIIB-type zinc ribbon-containing protein [Bacillota bacterium]